MLTFQDQREMYQQISQDFTPAGLLIAKRDINEGGAMFLNRLGRKFNKEYLTSDLKAGQQYYQFSALTLRLGEARFLQGNNYYIPQLVTSEEEWNNINSILTTGSFPTHMYIKGYNELGIYPMPSADIPNGIKISHEPQHTDLTQDDFTGDSTPAGTLTVANDNTAITHSANGFSSNMVGRWLQVTDGSDGKWYRITSFTSASQLNLENYYEGISGSGRSFRIGEIMKIPDAYQDAPVFYALDRFYQAQNDQKTASAYQLRFDMKVKSAKETYGKSTSRQGVKTRRQSRRATWIDLTPPVIYP